LLVRPVRSRPLTPCACEHDRCIGIEKPPSEFFRRQAFNTLDRDTFAAELVGARSQLTMHNASALTPAIVSAGKRSNSMVEQP
jgi:hypothetical protein